MIKEGKFLDDIITSKPTSKYDKIYYDYANINDRFCSACISDIKKIK